MKALSITLWGLVQVAGCSVGKPPAEEVAKIEAQTARSACVGTLAAWHREFYFQPALGVIGNGVDKSLINVGYISAGYEGQGAGRVIKEPPTSIDTDDGQHAIAWGRWSRKKGQFTEWHCGCNVGSPVNRSGPPICPANDS